jgi:methylenetetrahydrofolate dehydrogenase (NADP+)/methenyltetrahydrofolate cyclohydrolase
MKIIAGQKLAEKIKDKIAAEVFALGKVRPQLAIILANDREDSKLYVSLKEREAKKVGIDTHLYKLTSQEGEKELLEVINFLNNDPAVDGILVQLPLPEKFDTDKIIAAINPKKDADGFHPEHPDYMISPVFAAVLECLKSIKFDWEDKKIAVLYNSEIFGQTLREILKERGAQVRIVSVKNFDKLNDQESEAKTQEIMAATQEADALITALGLPKFVKAEMIKENAALIDIGITKVGDKVYGDIDFESVKDKAGYITPVPGGIGPLTIALLFRNVLEIFKHRP